MTANSRSKLFAAALAFAVAIPLTFGGSLASATEAQAGVLGGLKSAAKRVGTTVKGIGAAAKVGGGMVKMAGKGVSAIAKDGVRSVGSGARTVGSTVANGTFKVVHKVEVAGQKAQAVGQAIGKRLR